MRKLFGLCWLIAVISRSYTCNEQDSREINKTVLTSYCEKMRWAHTCGVRFQKQDVAMQQRLSCYQRIRLNSGRVITHVHPVIRNTDELTGTTNNQTFHLFAQRTRIPAMRIYILILTLRVQTTLCYHCYKRRPTCTEVARSANTESFF